MPDQRRSDEPADLAIGRSRGGLTTGSSSVAALPAGQPIAFSMTLDDVETWLAGVIADVEIGPPLPAQPSLPTARPLGVGALLRSRGLGGSGRCADRRQGQRLCRVILDDGLLGRGVVAGVRTRR